MYYPQIQARIPNDQAPMKLAELHGGDCHAFTARVVNLLPQSSDVVYLRNGSQFSILQSMSKNDKTVLMSPMVQRDIKGAERRLKRDEDTCCRWT